MIQGELKTLGSKKANSILRNKTKAGLLSFSWDKVWKELEMHAPIFLGLLEAILRGKTAKISRTQPIVCMVVAIMAKYINSRMNVVQSYISLLLHAGHCSKQVKSNNRYNLGLYFEGVLSSAEAHVMHVIEYCRGSPMVIFFSVLLL